MSKATTKAEAPEPQMDWQQVALNGGPPCFAVLDDEEGWYCGRAERWEGHDGEHAFVSLQQLLASTRPADLAPTGEKCVKCGHVGVLYDAKINPNCIVIVGPNGAPCGCKCEFAPAAQTAAEEINRRIAAIAPDDRVEKITAIIESHCGVARVPDAARAAAEEISENYLAAMEVNEIERIILKHCGARVPVEEKD